MLKKKLLLLGLLVLPAVAVALGLFPTGSNPAGAGGTPRTINLSRGPFTVFDFPSLKPATSALFIFGSGDGGWGSLEKSICHALQEKGCAVIGIDFTAYARTDYNLDILQADYGKIARTILGTFRNQPTPLIVSGYSMGAAQAIAAAGGPHPPPGLTGLLVIDALSRGRYGLRPADQMNVLPEGPGTFGVASFSGSMGSVRVVQWHAENDPIDSHAWLDSLTAPHRFFTFPEAGHDYGVNRDDFIHQLVESVSWLIHPAARSAEASTHNP
jgi:hypothetical protein